MDSNAIVNIIRSKIRKTPTTGIVLGSGLRIIANHLEKIVKFPYKDIQGLPKASVEGHAGELLLADFNSEKIISTPGPQNSGSHFLLSLQSRSNIVL